MSTSPPELTKEMQRAVAFAREHGFKIHRHPGGFWGTEKYQDMQVKWFGTSTVGALVLRGVAVWSKYQAGKSGEFPIEATING